MSRITDLIAKAKAKDAQLGADLRVLDLTNNDVRRAIEKATSAKALFEGVLAKDYS